jgi:hypothetical protein
MLWRRKRQRSVPSQPGDTPRLLVNRFADALGPGGGLGADGCECFAMRFRDPEEEPLPPVQFHIDRQDTSAPGWQHLVDLIDEAATDGRDTFMPLAEMSPSERLQIVTLPASIGRLRRVKKLVLYGSHLVRLPTEIGLMTALEVFEPYTSYRLHWFPYEITACENLRDSTVSTRALYGNMKNRAPFPPLQSGVRLPDNATDLDPGVWGSSSIKTCSVCGASIHDLVYQAWVVQVVATDRLPLLVNACSAGCVETASAASASVE